VDKHTPPANGRGRAVVHQATSGGPGNRKPNKRFDPSVAASEVVSKLFQQRLQRLRLCDRVLSVLEAVPREVFWSIRARRAKIQDECERLTTRCPGLALSNNGAWLGEEVRDGK
jgi:hypothetical protein